MSVVGGGDAPGAASGGDGPGAATATAWGSTLSAQEMAAVGETGFSPVGSVMGSAVVRLGIDYSPGQYASAGAGAGGVWGGGSGAPWAGRPAGPWGGAGGVWGGGAGGAGVWGGGAGGVWGGRFPGWYRYYPASGGWAWAWNWERTVFESGIEQAATSAVDRLAADAARFGAHGVVATRLRFSWLEGLVATVEFTAVGTAVLRAGTPALARPFTSGLSGQDLLKALRAGLVPVTLAVGVGSVSSSASNLQWGASFQEIEPFGEAHEASRRIAAERLSQNPHARGTAVLGTDVSSWTQGEAGGGERVVNTVLTGTVVKRFASGAWTELALPVLRLSRP